MIETGNNPTPRFPAHLRRLLTLDDPDAPYIPEQALARAVIMRAFLDAMTLTFSSDTNDGLTERDRNQARQFLLKTESTPMLEEWCEIGDIPIGLVIERARHLQEASWTI